jgi:hypothetical protein
VLYLGYANLIVPGLAASQHALAEQCPLFTHCAVCFADKPPLPIACNIWRATDLEVADLRDHLTRKADAVGTLKRGGGELPAGWSKKRGDKFAQVLFEGAAGFAGVRELMPLNAQQTKAARERAAGVHWWTSHSPLAGKTSLHYQGGGGSATVKCALDVEEMVDDQLMACAETVRGSSRNVWPTDKPVLGTFRAQRLSVEDWPAVADYVRGLRDSPACTSAGFHAARKEKVASAIEGAQLLVHVNE